MSAPGVADFSGTDVAVAAGVESALLNVIARGVRRGQKVRILAHVAGLGALGTLVLTLRVRRGTGITGVQIGEDVNQQIPGAVSAEAAAVFVDNATIDDPTYTVNVSISGAGATALNYAISVESIS